MATVFQFVNSIASSPTVRLDLDAAPWSVHRDTSFPPPPLARSISSSMLADGAIIPASAYENRVIRLVLKLRASSNDEAATELQKLARELNRPRNILKWQPDTASPVFFRTFRSPDYIDDGSDYGVGDLRIEIPLIAEPFAYGLKVTLGPFTVAQNPASGVTNPTYVDLTGVTGDIETPARVRLGDLADGETTVVATRRRGTPSAGTYLAQAEAFNLGADTTLVAGGSTYSGSSNNTARISFTTVSTSTWRLSDDFPNAGGSQPADFRGTYRVLARVKATTTNASEFGIQLRYGLSEDMFADEVFFSTSATTFRIIDLGLISFPTANDPIYDGYTGVELGSGSGFVAVYVQQVSGTADLDIDYLQFIPADAEYCAVTWPEGNSPVLDGPNDETWNLNGTDVHSTADPIKRTGSLPMLTPNQTNRLWVIRKVQTSHLIADTIVANVDFWPRYLTIRPSAT